MLLTFAVDLAKVYVGRAASFKGMKTVLELTIVPRFHKMLTDIFETSELSDEDQRFIANHLEELNARAAEKAANIASALRDSRESQG
jgi:hypothetical protein